MRGIVLALAYMAACVALGIVLAEIITGRWRRSMDAVTFSARHARAETLKIKLPAQRRPKG